WSSDVCSSDLQGVTKKSVRESGASESESEPQVAELCDDDDKCRSRKPAESVRGKATSESHHRPRESRRSRKWFRPQYPDRKSARRPTAVERRLQFRQSAMNSNFR